MLFKVSGQVRQFRPGVIERNGPARLCPDLRLRVQLRSSHRILDKLQARMSRPQGAKGRAAMPGHTVPKQEDRHRREGVQDKLKMGGASAGRQVLAARDQFRAWAQVERALEPNFGASWVNAQQRPIANRRPDTPACRLPIPPGCILTQNDRFRRVVSHIHPFFSVVAWNSTLSRSRRDVYPFSVRW